MSNLHRMDSERRALFLKVRNNRRVKVTKWGNGQFFVTMLRNNQIVDNYYQALKWMIVADELLFMPRFNRNLMTVFAVSDTDITTGNNDWRNKPVYSLNNDQKIIDLYHPEFVNQINYLKHHQNISDGALNLLKEWIKDKLICFMSQSVAQKYCYDYVLDMVKKEIIL